MKILVGKRQSGKTTAAKEWSKSFSTIWLHTKQPRDWFENEKLPEDVNVVQNGIHLPKYSFECVIFESDFSDYELYRDELKPYLFNNCFNNVCILTQHATSIPYWILANIPSVYEIKCDPDPLTAEEEHLLKQVKDAIDGDTNASMFVVRNFLNVNEILRKVLHLNAIKQEDTY